MAEFAIVQGKSISKSDKELVQAIMGGEMKNAWQPGDGVDERPDYLKRSWEHASARERYRMGYDNIQWEAPDGTV